MLGSRKQATLRILAVIVGIVLVIAVLPIIDAATKAPVDLANLFAAFVLGVVLFLAGLSLIGWAVLPPKLPPES